MSSFQSTQIQGCYVFRMNPRFEDERGLFVKPLHRQFLKDNGVDFKCRESFVSFSKPKVLRGMHFQTEPFSHDKIVSCLSGEIFDVVVDLRSDSKTYGVAESFRLSGESGQSVFIPVGCAHGFQVTGAEGAWVVYYTSREHHPENDQGILWSSVPMDWPVKDPVVSSRDKNFGKLADARYF